jgi:HAD superfamily hydrolase (TIGR01509 family)
MITGIKHIIFDLGNVLLNIDPALTLAELKALNIPDFDRVYRRLTDDKVFERLEINMLNPQQFAAAICAAANMELEEQAIFKAWNALLLDFPLRRLQILQQLQLHYDLVLLSNTNEIHETQFNATLLSMHGIPNIGVFFDKVYYSHRLGLRKPDTAIFQRVLDECGFVPAQTLFIDDIEENTKAAASLGIQAIWLKEGMTIENDIFLHVAN